MKVVIKDNGESNLVALINGLKKQGFDDFIVFSKINKRKRFQLENTFYNLGIKLALINFELTRGTYDLLSSVKGSLSSAFLLVYSSEVQNLDLKGALYYHKASQKIATLLLSDKKTNAIFLENEVFDYMARAAHFEKCILARIFEDDEAGIYSALSAQA